MEAAFWFSVFIVFYTFIGYGILLYLLVKVRRLLAGRRGTPDFEKLPSVTLVVAAYNEADILREKISNTLRLSYPEDKLEILFVTDGSSDDSPRIVGEYERIRLLHEAERKGKIHAIHRAMQQVESEVVVFTDANTFLNREALLLIARHYAEPSVGAVSGEKRVHIDSVSDATAGEGIYWKYESALKKLDSELYSVVGAAGELFSVRRSLYEAVPEDTILDDFMISLKIAEKGYRIVYEPEAFAMEHASESVGEEFKRKVRIAAGGIQSICRLSGLLNPFNNFLLSFQYVSHRVLRWTVTPFLLVLAFFSNAVLAFDGHLVYGALFTAQVVFYSAAFAGYLLSRTKMKVKVLFVPYYFCFMNYAVVAGIIRYLGKRQSSAWEKARRKPVGSAAELQPATEV